MLRATRDHEPGDATQIGFKEGNVLTYMPQRPAGQGLGVGSVGGKEGIFRLDATEAVNGAAADAPPAVMLPETDHKHGEGSASMSDQCLPASGQSTRKRLSLILNEPESCRAAKIVSVWVMSLILVSTAAFMLETLPAFHVDGGPELIYPAIWDNLETFVVLQFSLEYGLRLATCEDPVAFTLEPMNVVDLAAIAPWYLELLHLAGSGSAVLRVFRLARVIRIFKLGKYAAGLQMFARTLVSSADALMLLFFFLAIATVLASSVMYFVERGEWSVAEQQWLTAEGEPSQFTSIPATFWWCVVTLTTVGYGDVVPVTVPGRLVAVATMLAGVLTIALPVSILGSNFQVEYDKQEKEKKRKQAMMHAARVTTAKELVSPLQQELTKMGELFAEMDSLTRLAQEKQTALLRIANSPLFHEHAVAP